MNDALIQRTMSELSELGVDQFSESAEALKELFSLTDDPLLDIEKHGFFRVRAYAIWYEINDVLIDQFSAHPERTARITELLGEIVGVGRKYDLLSQLHYLARVVTSKNAADAVLREMGL